MLLFLGGYFVLVLCTPMFSFLNHSWQHNHPQSSFRQTSRNKEFVLTGLRRAVRVHCISAEVAELGVSWEATGAFPKCKNWFSVFANNQCTWLLFGLKTTHARNKNYTLRLDAESSHVFIYLFLLSTLKLSGKKNGNPVPLSLETLLEQPWLWPSCVVRTPLGDIMWINSKHQF